METKPMVEDGQCHQIINLLTTVNGFPSKEAWVLQRTGGRTSEVKKMLAEEAVVFIAWLAERDAAMNRMRRKLISLAHQLGWKDAKDPEGKKADYARINRWLTTYSASKKILARQDAKELKASLDQFEAVWRKELQK